MIISGFDVRRDVFQGVKRFDFVYDLVWVYFPNPLLFLFFVHLAWCDMGDVVTSRDVRSLSLCYLPLKNS